MISNESNSNDNFHVDGIQLRIRETNLIVLAIPEKRYNSNSFIDISVDLINNTSNPFHLNPKETLITEVLTLDGQAMQGEMAPDELVYRGKEDVHSQSSFGFRLSQFISNLIHWFWKIPKRTFEPQLVNSRQGRTVTLTLKLFWKSNLLQLQVTNSPSYSPIIFSLLDKSWSFKALQPNTYQLRFLWGIPPSDGEFSSDSETTQGISAGQLATQFVNFALIKPTGADRSAVEVDGIRFETLMPERVLTLPEKSVAFKLFCR